MARNVVPHTMQIKTKERYALVCLVIIGCSRAALYSCLFTLLPCQYFTIIITAQNSIKFVKQNRYNLPNFDHNSFIYETIA